MKKLITIFLLTICSTVTIAQNKKELTKEEIVKFLQNKFDEAKEEYLFDDYGSKTFIKSLSIGYSYFTLNIKVVSRIKDSISSAQATWSDWENVAYYDFNPKDIIAITDVVQINKQIIGYLQIKFASKNCRSSSEINKVIKSPQTDSLELMPLKISDDNRQFIQYIKIPYSKSDPENFNKLKGAFEYLKKLSLQYEDSFGK
ncbi:hypothetical protein [Flavobacterium sp.]|uniref:hypothetical protein n=1 Tax=Flavobacterium sp. TaxID=239 RepID=UPI003C496E49